MDYKQEMFYRMPNQDMSKMPFYMAYPMQTVYLEELEYERDMQKLKDLYPKEVRSIQAMVEDECDKMEYEGSLMFDEYPDKLMLKQIVNRIYDGAIGGKRNIQSFEVSPYESEQYESEQYESEQYESEQYKSDQYGEEDMQAEELPLEGKLIEQRRPPGPGWGPGRPPGPPPPPPGPGWGPGRPPGPPPPPPGPGWGPGRPPGPPPPPPGPGWGPGRPPRPGRPPKDNGLQNLIEVLLFNEMYQRRCRHKRCRRWW